MRLGRRLVLLAALAMVVAGLGAAARGEVQAGATLYDRLDVAPVHGVVAVLDAPDALGTRVAPTPRRGGATGTELLPAALGVASALVLAATWATYAAARAPRRQQQVCSPRGPRAPPTV